MCIKRPMKVVVDSTALDNERFYVSAGRIGYQLEMASSDIVKATGAVFADIRRPDEQL